MTGRATWILGNDPACDLVVGNPSVSWRHCRLTREPDGSYTVDDLGSTNGTFVNGVRVHGPTAVRRHDAVTLGLSVPLPWPPEADPPGVPHAPAQAPPSRVVRVGREPDNDLVLDSPEVSAHHARVITAPGGVEGVVEDLGSTNGTSVGAPGRRVTRAGVRPGDTVYFGPVAVPASFFFERDSAGETAGTPELVAGGMVTVVGRDADCDVVVDFPMVSGRHARVLRAGRTLVIEDLLSSNGTFVNGVRVERTAEVRPGDLIGLGSYNLRLTDGRDAPPPGPLARPRALRSTPEGALETAAPTPARLPTAYAAAVGVGLGAQAGVLAEWILLGSGSRPSAVFALVVAAAWVGMCSALFESLLAPPAARGSVASGLARSLGRPAVFDLVLCGALLGIVSARVPFGERWMAAWGVLWLTSMAGTALVSALIRASGRLAVGLGGAVVLVGLAGAVGGPARPVATLPGSGRLAAALLPTRWAFEALLTLAPTNQPAADPVEPFFPAETDRAGLGACSTALVALLGALVYADAVIALARATRERAPASSGR